MNSRIQEIADQCWDYGRGTVNTKKFAELIIQECVNSCNSLWYKENNRTLEENTSRDIGIHVGIKSGILQCVGALSKLKEVTDES